MSQISTLTTFETFECWVCGLPFALSWRFKQNAVRDGSTFCCPKGCRLRFGEGEIERLTREKVALQARLDGERAMRTTAEHVTAIARGKLAAAKHRARSGVCPDCHRSFANVRRHMATKHVVPQAGGTR